MVLLWFNPDSFQIPGGTPETEALHMLYYSYVTLTTLGYGDVLPLTLTARIWSAAEAVTGVLYLAVLVARLVGMYKRR